MSLVNNKTESERIQKVKDRALYASYLVAQTQNQGGCNPFPAPIQSGSGASKESSVLIDIRLGAQYTTVAESISIILQNTCSVVPGPPLNVTAVPGDGQATVSWNAPLSDGGSQITSYTVSSSPGDFTVSTLTTSVIITGLTNLTSYTFTVIATNSQGNSRSSISAAVLPRATLYSSDGATLSGWSLTAVPTVDNTFGNPSPSIKIVGANTSIRRSVAASGQTDGTNTTYEFDAYIITKRFWFKFGCDSAGANGPSLTFLSDTKNGLTESTGSWGYSDGVMADTNITVSLNTWHTFKIQCAAGTNNTVWYLDGVLQANTYTYAGNGTHLGFIVDNGSAYVDNIAIYQGIV